MLRFASDLQNSGPPTHNNFASFYQLIRHPNIVRLYDVIETDKFIGIVLEYASGGELFDHILAHRYLRERDASKLFAQLISGVWYCHKKQIVHRDLKLENLLLDRNRNVIITDFGFANHYASRENDLMQTSCGSPCYAAPELVISEGLYVGSAVDVWSCGVILYAMLAGYLPFDDDPNNPDGDNINLLYKYIVSTPLTFPEYVSQEARDLLGIMLVPDPKYRATLEQVMNHSWLGAFKPMFSQSVRELEHAAHQQQLEKRQQYQRQMRERAAPATPSSAGGAATSASRHASAGTPSRNRTTSGYPTSEPFAEERAQAQAALQQQQPIYSTASTSPSTGRARPVTTSVTLTGPSASASSPSNAMHHVPSPIEEDPISINNVTTPTAAAASANAAEFPFTQDYSMSSPTASGATSSQLPIGSADARSRKESTSGRSRSGTARPSSRPPAVTATSPDGGVTPSSAPPMPSSPPRSSANTTSPQTPATERKRRAAAARHTIQLEYGSVDTTGSGVGFGIGLSGSPQPAPSTTANASANVTRDATPRASGERTPVAATSSFPASAPPVPSPTKTSPTATAPPMAAAGAKKTRRDSDGIDTLHYDPYTSEPIPRDLFHEPDPAVVRALSEKEKVVQGLPTATSASTNANVKAASTSPNEVLASPTSVTSPTALSPSPSVSTAPTSASPGPATTGSARHRRGVSMDKFGLGKVLGAAGTPDSPASSANTTPPPPSAGSAAIAVAQAQALAQATSDKNLNNSAKTTPASPVAPSSASQTSRKSITPSAASSTGGFLGRLSRRQSTASVHSDKSAGGSGTVRGASGEKDSLHQMLQQQQVQAKMAEETNGGKKRRKTLSIMIDPMKSALPKGMRRGTKTNIDTPVMTNTPPVPNVLSPVDQATTPTLAAPVPVPTAPRNPPVAFPGAPPSRQPSVSTGKAKKVMDWFRKKSLVQELENEEPVLVDAPDAPQVVVTDPTSPGPVRLGPTQPASASAPPSSWGGQRVASSSATLQNGSATGSLLSPPTATHPVRSASTREGSSLPPRAIATSTTVAPNLVLPMSGMTTGAVPPMMRPHEGAVDPALVTSGASAEMIFREVLRVLKSMGLDVASETIWKVNCVRPKMRKEGGARQSGLAAFSISGLGGSNGTDRRGLPVPPQSGSGLKGLFRRGSSQAPVPAPSTRSAASITGSTTMHSLEGSDHPPFTPTTPEANSAHQSTDSVHEAGGPGSSVVSSAITPIAVEPIYGKRNEDKGGEVLFSVELTWMAGLANTYHVDIRRMKGEMKTWQFLYTKVKERCNFRGAA
ncbi:Pkinase-domain-containing protein [Clavulina sp. PMI_390]|nr:Pkinase-domain-containing protein [Clavulina sp. PMI_390]